MSMTKQTRNPEPRWTEKQRLFQMWLALPDEERDVKRQEDVAAQLGVARQTLSQWKQLPGFMDAVNEQAYALLRDSLHDAFKVIKQRALKSDKIEWMNLYLSIIGGAQAVAGSNSTMQYSSMTEDEATAIFERVTGAKLSARVASNPEHIESEKDDT